MVACTIAPEKLPHCGVCTEIAILAEKEQAKMTTTVVLPTPVVTRDYETVKKTVEVQEPVYTVKLDAVRAGYLRDLLMSHVAGEIATLLKPISVALGAAGAARDYATNTNKREPYNDGYGSNKAILDFADDYDRELAGVAPKSKTKF